MTNIFYSMTKTDPSDFFNIEQNETFILMERKEEGCTTKDNLIKNNNSKASYIKKKDSVLPLQETRASKQKKTQPRYNDDNVTDDVEHNIACKLIQLYKKRSFLLQQKHANGQLDGGVSAISFSVPWREGLSG